MKTSAIGWTDYSGGDLNFVTGCTLVSEGCANCYARRIYERFGRDFAKVTFHEDKITRLLHKRFPEYSPKRGAPHKPMCFVCDTGDLFHESLDRMQMLMAISLFWMRPEIIWLVLTKRPERMLAMARFWCEYCGDDMLPANVWCGVTAENPGRLGERYPFLDLTPAKTKFLSIEPMLEPMAEAPYMAAALDAVDWVICGAESGPQRRPFEVQWAVDLYEQCRAAGISFFGKQDSDLYPGKPLVLGDYGVVREWPAGEV